MKATRIALLSAILAGSIIAVFLPIKDHDFTNWDDPEYLLFNMHTQSLNWSNVQWAFTSFHSGNYHPITWLSHMVDASIYGLDPRGHHLSSLAFHIANTLLVFLVFSRLTGDYWTGFWLALLFGLHPLNVESVVWISERKNLLSMLFALLAVDAYHEYTQDPRWPKYIPIVLFFLLSLLSKPMMVTLPLLLLLLDWWPLHRLNKRAVLEKVPLLVLSLLGGLTTMAAQSQAHAMALLGRFSLADRLGHAAVSYWLYAGRILWPAGLTPYYPLPGLEAPNYATWIPWAAAVALLLVGIVTLLLSRRVPVLTVAWFWFLITLVPVIGIIPAGAQGMADRYAYVPMLGILGPIAGCLTLLRKEARIPEKALELAWKPAAASPGWARADGIVLGLSLTLLAVTWAITSRHQLGIWRNSLSLWEYAQEHCPSCYVVRFNLADALIQAGRIREALPHLEAAVAIRPADGEAYSRLADTHNMLSNLEAAERFYATAIERDPRNPAYHLGRGRVLLRMRQWGTALSEFNLALQRQPQDPEILTDLARALWQLGRQAEARQQLQQALKVAPDSEEVRHLLKSLR